VCARDGSELAGYVNVAWDGGVHAFILDTLVTARRQRQGIGIELVALAVEQARAGAASGSMSTSKITFARSTSAVADSGRRTLGSSPCECRARWVKLALAISASAAAGAHTGRCDVRRRDQRRLEDGRAMATSTANSELFIELGNRKTC